MNKYLNDWRSVQCQVFIELIFEFDFSSLMVKIIDQI